MSQLYSGNWRASARNLDQYSGDTIIRHAPYPMMRKPRQLESKGATEWTYGSKSLKSRIILPKMDRFLSKFQAFQSHKEEALPSEMEATLAFPLYMDDGSSSESDLPAAPPPPPPAKSICTRVFTELPEVRAPPPTPRYRSLACYRLGYANVFDAAIATAQQRMQEGNLNTARRSMEQRVSMNASDANALQCQRARGPQHLSTSSANALKSSTSSLARQRRRQMVQPMQTERITASRGSRNCIESLRFATATPRSGMTNSNLTYRPRLPVAPMQFPLATARGAIGVIKI